MFNQKKNDIQKKLYISVQFSKKNLYLMKEKAIQSDESLY